MEEEKIRGYLKGLMLILVFFVILTLFASKAPDGLMKVVETLEIDKPESSWSGLMPDYALPRVDNPYISTILAGVFGIFLVFLVSLSLGKAITRPTVNDLV